MRDAKALLNHPDISIDVPQTWADLGCGAGLFTTALSYQLAYGSKIFAVDKDIKVFKADQHEGVILEKVKADFVLDTLTLNVANLDGILMANSFHFVHRKIEFINKLARYFRQRELFLIVEYDTNAANAWVPYPISFYSLKEFFFELGFGYIEKIHELRSRYNNGNIYAALIKRS
ncbi:MAG TPA: methyltransferase domain-containing protein [Flavitalea sp.]|nr:methyltransferase domain-containing protein [Flavitalea sp.]